MKSPFAGAPFWAVARSLLAVSSLVTLSGCEEFLPGEETSEQQQGIDWSTYDAEPGTCDGWKVSYCEASELCGYSTASDCQYSVGLVECHADAPHSECEKEFKKTINKDDCSLFPKDCFPRDIADTSAAVRACRDLQAQACEHDYYCGFNFDIDSCISQTSALYQCDRRISIGEGIESCPAEIATLTCADPIPASCEDHTRFELR